MELYRGSYTTVTFRVALSFLTVWLHQELLREVRRIFFVCQTRALKGVCRFHLTSLPNIACFELHRLHVTPLWLEVALWHRALPTLIPKP